MCFSLQNYRHVAVGITRQHVKPIAKSFQLYNDTKGNADLAMVLAWQTCHRSEQGASTYGLDGAFPTSLQPELLNAYRDVSTIWHRWLGLLTLNLCSPSSSPKSQLGVLSGGRALTSLDSPGCLSPSLKRRPQNNELSDSDFKAPSMSDAVAKRVCRGPAQLGCISQFSLTLIEGDFKKMEDSTSVLKHNLSSDYLTPALKLMKQSISGKTPSGQAPSQLKSLELSPDGSRSSIVPAAALVSCYQSSTMIKPYQMPSSRAESPHLSSDSVSIIRHGWSLEPAPHTSAYGTKEQTNEWEKDQETDPQCEFEQEQDLKQKQPEELYIKVPKKRRRKQRVIKSHNETYYVHQILKWRQARSQCLEYLVEWKHYPNKKDFTWEPAQRLKEDVPEMVEAFESMKKDGW
jgi:Chromo (CHRromatin Organisation MOdifier) domain